MDCAPNPVWRCREHSALCPVMSNLVAELDAQLQEIRYGIQSATAASSDGVAAVSTVVTLEGLSLAVRMDDGGVHVLPEADRGSSSSACSYDSVNSMLLNQSAGFVAKFNESLSAALAAAAREQGEQGAQRWADVDEDDYGSFKSYDSGQDDRPWH